MVNPSDLLPALYQYGNIAHEYLHKHLTDEQISDYLDYLQGSTTTHGQAFRHITREHGHPETVFYVLASLSRINAFCDAAECPDEESYDPGRAFHVAFSALQAGIMIGTIADDKGKEAILAWAKLGKKFGDNVGRKPDKLTTFLENIVSNYYQEHNKLPSYKIVLSILETLQGQGFIHTIDDESIEWGENGTTSLRSLENRLVDIRGGIKSR